MNLLSNRPEALAARVAGGLVLMVLGWLVLPAGPADRVPVQVPAKAGDTASVDAPTPAPATSKYRLAYEQEDGYWTAAPLGGAPSLLTDMVPGPRDVSVPERYLTAEEVGDVLVRVLRAWKLRPTGAERRDLLALRLGGKPLFQANELDQAGEGATASKPKKAEPVEVAADRFGSDAVAAKTETLAEGEGPWTWSLPAEINPASASCTEHLRAWRDALLPMLRSVERRRDDVHFTIQRDSGENLRIKLSASVRKRILAGSFGNSRVDVALYLQYQAVARGADLVLDGAFGPGSRAAWRLVLARDGLPGPLIDGYLRFLEGYFGRGIPPQLDPSDASFNKDARALAGWVRARLGENPVRCYAPFLGRTATWDIGPAARARLLAGDFGSRPKDEVIALQLLAGLYGAPVVVDGDFGAGSRDALCDVLRKTFRRADTVPAYRRLLETRYP